MGHTSEKADIDSLSSTKPQKKSADGHSTKGELVVKGVATAVAASAIIQTGQGVVKSLAKQPLVLFGLGIVAGFFTHKYRKEIIAITSKTAEQSKDFIVRQKEGLKDMLAETQDPEIDQD